MTALFAWFHNTFIRAEGDPKRSWTSGHTSYRQTWVNGVLVDAWYSDSRTQKLVEDAQRKHGTEKESSS